VSVWGKGIINSGWYLKEKRYWILDTGYWILDVWDLSVRIGIGTGDW